MIRLFRPLALAMMVVCTLEPGHTQPRSCPIASATAAPTPSVVRGLRGTLIYHNGIRQWFELGLDRPTCGQHSIQLLARNQGSTLLDRIRGCRIVSTGTIDFSPTGYYTLDLFQDVESAHALGRCTQKPALPKPNDGMPDPAVRRYTVFMDVDYRPGDHPVVFHVRSGKRALHPSHAYADYMLTGGFVLYGMCGEGLVVDTVFGTRAARPSHLTEPRGSGDMATYDPESAAQAGVTDLHLGYTCVRAP